MRPQYPLFQTHLDLVYRYWTQLVLQGDIIVDATCGNGQDTLRLAKLALAESTGKIYAIDIQQKAINLTSKYLKEHLSPEQFSNIIFQTGCHSQFPIEIEPQSVKLIVYNLGYLPGGGNKELTTLTSTTLQSIQQALLLLVSGGAMTITCYPGHEEGELEEGAVLHFLRQLAPEEWNICHHRWINRKKAPSLIVIQKKLDLQGANPITV